MVYAVEGAESSHGADAAMWRVEPAGPQGPMQVSEKAAMDVGGGNRLDIEQNRRLGRAYLDLLHRRYGNWVDAISAYNWDMSRIDRWIKEGRSTRKPLPGVARYVQRVLNESGLPPLNIAVQNRVNFVAIKPHLDNVYLPGLEQSGQPLPALASSGRPLPTLQQSGRLLSGLGRSAAIAPKNAGRWLTAFAERLTEHSSATAQSVGLPAISDEFRTAVDRLTAEIKRLRERSTDDAERTLRSAEASEACNAAIELLTAKIDHLMNDRIGMPQQFANELKAAIDTVNSRIEHLTTIVQRIPNAAELSSDESTSRRSVTFDAKTQQDLRDLLKEFE